MSGLCGIIGLMKKTLLSAVAVFILAVPLLALAQGSPVRSISDVQKVLVRIAEIVGYIFWIAATISALYSGFLYLTAGGEAEKLSKAKRQIWYTIIAVAIAVMATGFPALVKDILTPR